ncbi:hypothetical protein ACU19_05175 [Actinobaculum suis]|uniref:hypothetical protein n=1 Tax=Actinobaculum suis TaxID=1657 RepID=UPI00066FC95E|nr:hypothetical protein [Actinobaculum suis]KMY23261.1 hypothetical protein ACU19_05175 [Actinobaculum suis]
MKIKSRLGVYWRSRAALQIGTDPRAGVVIAGLSAREQDFISALTVDRSLPEITRLAQQHGLDTDRLYELLELLHRARVIDHPLSLPDTGSNSSPGTGSNSLPDTSFSPRPGTASTSLPGTGSSRLPGTAPNSLPGTASSSEALAASAADNLETGGAESQAETGDAAGMLAPVAGRHICVPRLDPLGVEIVFALALAGAASVVTFDAAPTGFADHPALLNVSQIGTGTRVEAMRGALGMRDLQLEITVTTDPLNTKTKAVATTRGRATAAEVVVDAAVVTAAGAINPLECDVFFQAGIPHLLVCSEDVDVTVGPYVVPGQSACARCVYEHRVDADPEWAYISPQLFARPPGFAPLLELQHAALLAARALCCLELCDQQLRIPPPPGIPGLATIRPGATCACTATDFPPLDIPQPAPLVSESPTVISDR